MDFLTLEELLILAITFIGFSLTYVVFQKFFDRRDLTERMQRIQKSDHSDTEKLSLPQDKKNKLRVLQKNSSNKGSKSWTQMFSMPTSKAKIVFERAGLNPINAPAILALANMASFLFFVTLALGLVIFVPPFNTQLLAIQACVVILGILIGVKFVGAAMNFKTKMRYEKIRRDLSSALDLLVVCTNAGLSIDKSFEHVSKEMGASSPELGKELALAAIELSILPDRRVAFQNLAKRVSIPLVRGMATTLVQAEEQGSSISQTLKILSHEFSQKVLLEAEAKAAKLPAVLSIPVVVLILPSLLIVLLAPAILNLNDTYHFF